MTHAKQIANDVAKITLFASPGEMDGGCTEMVLDGQCACIPRTISIERMMDNDAGEANAHHQNTGSQSNAAEATKPVKSVLGTEGTAKAM